MPDQWHRALLRAELRELGYDALGAADVAGGLLYPRQEAGRGAVRLILVDQRALTTTGHALLPELLARHEAPAVLLAPAGGPPAAGPWIRVLSRPLSIADITQTVQELLPAGNTSRPIL
jgi:hypothetical protein